MNETAPFKLKQVMGVMYAALLWVCAALPFWNAPYTPGTTSLNIVIEAFLEIFLKKFK